MALICLNQVFSFGIFRRMQSTILCTIVAASSIILRRLGLGGCILVGKHQIVVFCRWLIRKLAIDISLVTLAASVICSRIGTLCRPLSFFAL